MGHSNKLGERGIEGMAKKLDGMRRVKLNVGNSSNDMTFTDMDTGEDLFKLFGFVRRMSFDLAECEPAIIKLELYVSEFEVEGVVEVEST